MSSSSTDRGVANRQLVNGVSSQVVGREREIELVVSALAADRHILLEGPPGTGKSTLLRAVATQLGVDFYFVEGNAELTPARLVGFFDPARVLHDGYDAATFVDGPLVASLREGALLYVEELNRVPEETLNVLVSVMSERSITVPRLGRVGAAPGFRLVAAMNPFDAVGTARISSAIYDRVCRLAVDYQTSDDEEAITKTQVRDSDPEIVRKTVELVRRTRTHSDVRIGSSVRGAIDMCAIAQTLAGVRNATPANRSVSLDAALLSLSGRIQVSDGSGRSPEAIITELWTEIFEPEPQSAADPGKATAPNGASPPSKDPRP